MRQDVFGVAYAEANAELGAISSRFEQLRARKEHLESVVRALGLMLGSNTPAPTSAPAHSMENRTAKDAPAQPQGPEPAAYSFNQVPVPLPDISETGGDPFQRRVRNALKMREAGNSQQDLQPAV